jgi:hypothetical protein
MIAIIHSNWDSDIVLDDGELEKLVQGEILSGEIANYDEIGVVHLSKNEDNFATILSLEWNIKEADKYNFKITSSGIEYLQKNNYIDGRYENGFNGSKLSIYGYKKDNLIKENIEFTIEMIKLNKGEGDD